MTENKQDNIDTGNITKENIIVAMKEGFYKYICIFYEPSYRTIMDEIVKGISIGFIEYLKIIHSNTFEYLVELGITKGTANKLNNINIEQLIESTVNKWLDKNKDEIINRIVSTTNKSNNDKINSIMLEMEK